MWEILKSNARKKREAEIVRQEDISKNIEAQRLNSVYLTESKRLNDKLNSESTKYIKKDNKRIKDANEICPKCSSKKVVDKISQLKGEINGSSSTYGGGSFLGGFSSFGSGSIHGSMDTFEINKCNECGNEWKKISYNHYGCPSWDEKMRFLRASIRYFNNKSEEQEPSYVKEVRDFWVGTKLEILSLLFTRTNFGKMYLIPEDNYVKLDMIEIIKGKEDILINNLGFVK